MDDREKLRKRLSRLGGRKAQPKSSKRGVRHPGAVSELIGSEIETPAGPAFRIEEDFPQSHQHGRRRLDEILRFQSALTATVAQDPGLEGLKLNELVFLDTETTGLVGGAGTLVFLVGVGYFVEGGFELRQYFMRDPSEEKCMLLALEQDLLGRAGFVTFNGRAFDVPLLEMRYNIGARKHWPLSKWPHFDLLYPSRRLWRRTLSNCRLGTLEAQVLGVHRTDEDVPGELIPGLYLDYLRSGDASEMRKVVYHNAVDILSLVGLTVEILLRHEEGELPGLDPGEALGLARWHQKDGRNEQASAAYRIALGGDDESLKIEALRHYTLQLKREDRRSEAVPGWEEWHNLAPDDPQPCIELAMYYEWHAHDLGKALEWAQEALICLSHWKDDWRRKRMWQEIEHRIRRINAKSAGS